MKKICTLFVSLVVVLGLAVSPVFAGGGKNHGTDGEGEVVQGDTGGDASATKVEAPGFNAQGNMVDAP